MRNPVRIRLAVQRIRKALHIRESPYSHRLRSKIRPRRSKPYVPVKERRSSHLVDSYQRGYSTLAAIQDSDPNFLIYRKFGWLRNRLLLDLQDQLVTLEEELQLLDDNDARLRDPDKVLISRRNDELQKTLRQDLLRTIRQKLLEYGMRQVILIAALELIVIADEVLLHLQQVQHMRRPTFRNQNSLFNMIWSNKCQVHEEMEWILRREDLAALARDSEHGWFNGFVEDTLNAISRTMTAFIFRDPYRRKKTGKVDVSLLSQKRLEIFLRTIFIIVTPVLFLAPVFILLRLQPNDKDETRHKQILQMATVLTFTHVFSASCSIFTEAKRQEIVLATGAYCAVLVVFLGNTHDILVNGAK
ncbi:MAG: hypothetical protein LQ338_002683 [Usnochroma carphineum]|nr:MAG: hypothetical protein LQ338_002683 [Usnochroma carphineum]